MKLEEDDGWGRDSLRVANMLSIYRPEGIKEQTFVKTTGKSHDGRLFMHEKCTGQRASYTAQHINALLTRDINPDRLKERIVELIPLLSPAQQRQLASGLQEDALEVIRGLNPDTAALLERQREMTGKKLIANHQSGQTV
ncbi:MAG: hypothetical protein EBV03_11365 [Proteobacteria bacterium]|nr:hypothetical protein [Pseudomonadota bacterium]